MKPKDFKKLIGVIRGLVYRIGDMLEMGTMLLIACENSGNKIDDDFPEIRKIVKSEAMNKPIKDYELTRYRGKIKADLKK